MIRLLALLIAAGMLTAADKPFHEAEFVFPLEHWHNHSSSIVEAPNGDLLVTWYNGSGERSADDVKIEAARRPRGSKAWSPRFTLADTPAFPDCNPALFVDSKQRLWLFWPVILANEWHTALLEYRVASDWRSTPKWDLSAPLLFVPRNFAAAAKKALEAWPPSERRDRMIERAADKYFSRMGWMPRAHPIQLPSGRIIVPLYSDGYSFSLMAITDDGGLTWSTSEPLVGAGSIQPTIARKRDGTLVAYMRDNGPPPKRLHTSSSRDDGVTWSPVVDTDIPNPGAGMEVINLKDDSWAMIYNDTERGRHSLVVALSEDEGRSWPWKRHLELDERGQGAGSFHYPSIIQARDGSLHASYSYFLNHLPNGAPRKTIKHAHFNVAWVKEGDRR